jgi:hypothetical protein
VNEHPTFLLNPPYGGHADEKRSGANIRAVGLAKKTHRTAYHREGYECDDHTQMTRSRMPCAHHAQSPFREARLELRNAEFG